MLRFGISSASETLHENLPMAHANCDLYITPDIQENRDVTVIDTSTSSYLGVNKMNSCTKQHWRKQTHETKMADFNLRGARQTHSRLSIYRAKCTPLVSLVKNLHEDD